MTYTTLPIQEFLKRTSPFDQLSPDVVKQLSEKLQPLRYRIGQAILVRETMPENIAILYSGQARLLGYAPEAKAPETLQLLKPGEVLGWASLVRSVPCETVIASIETVCLTLPSSDFLALLNKEPTLADALSNRPALIEVFDLLGAELERRAQGSANLKELAVKACKEAVVLNLPPGKTPLHQLDPNLLWLLSGGSQTNFALSWFLPSLYRYRKVLLEVFIASFFVQLFGLANPLITQVIIDKILVQNSINTLHVLGIFLIVIALFEEVLVGDL